MRRLTAVLVVIAALAFSIPVYATERGDTGPEVRQVQEHLRWFGYVGVQVDGVFGPQTERAVRHFQRVNGLLSDGVVGPLTEDALAIRGEQIQVTTPPAPPIPTFANDCDEMSWYRQSAGLPEVFDSLGYHESRCRNQDDVRTFCCYGWWQNYIGSHLSSGSAYRVWIIEHCGVTSANDINSDTPDDKRRSACVTKVVYDIERSLGRSGLGPWQ